MDKVTRRLVSDNRKLRAVAISFELLEGMLKDGWESPVGEGLSVKSDIPTNAILISSFVLPEKMTGYLVFWHESFGYVPHGEEIPIADSPTITRVLGANE